MINIEKQKYDEAMDLIDELLRLSIYGESDENYEHKVREDLRLAVELLDDGTDREIYRKHKGLNETQN